MVGAESVAFVHSTDSLLGTDGVFHILVGHSEFLRFNFILGLFFYDLAFLFRFLLVF